MKGLAILPSVRWPRSRATREETRLLALRDGSPRPDGVFRPEAERRIRESLTEGAGQHNAGPGAEDERSVTDDIAGEPEREFAAVRTGRQPYADITASQLAAYRLAAARERTGPRPEYHPVPGTAPVTAPMPVLPGNAAVVPPPPPAPPVRSARPPAAGVPGLAVLRDVHAGLLRKQRAERAGGFSADKEALPFFGALTRELGWQGLHMPVRSLGRQYGHQRWTTERWLRQALAETAAATEAARAEVRADFDAIEARAARQLHAIRGTR